MWNHAKRSQASNADAIMNCDFAQAQGVLTRF